MKSISRQTFAITSILLVTLSFGAGWYAHRLDESSFVQIRENSPQYFYTNPLLFTQNNEAEFSRLDPLKESLEATRRDAIAAQNADRVSVYFREIDSGAWTGIDPDEVYGPGSMLKVATMLAYLNIGDADSSVLKENLKYSYADDPGQFYKPLPLRTGEYPVIALIQQMIVESDNSAMTLLNKHRVIDVLSVYKDLRLPDITESPDNFLSPRQYSRLFRVLYNATYLSRDYSESALKLLSLTKFRDGLVAGVPEDTVVAHKFGERRVLENGTEQYKQLHDCGIIYYPKKPYFLCVMTEGDDYKKLAQTIADMSQTTYEYVTSQTK